MAGHAVSDVGLRPLFPRLEVPRGCVDDGEGRRARPRHRVSHRYRAGVPCPSIGLWVSFCDYLDLMT